MSRTLNRYLIAFSILVMMAALIAGVAGCVNNAHNVEIRTWYDLDAVRGNLTASYILVNDLDSAVAGYQELAGPTANNGTGWQPIGSWDVPFAGSLDGRGHEVQDLFIDRPDEDHVGLFAAVNQSGTIKNIGVTNSTVIGQDLVGSLAGLNSGTVSNSYASGSVTGSSYHYHAGGLLGANQGTVTNSYSTGSVTGGSNVGGLMGTSIGTVSSCGSSSDVIATGDLVGGLVGVNDGAVTGSYSTGNVIGDLGVGGLLGANGHSRPGTVSNCYSTGSVTGVDSVGGLVGENQLDGVVSDSYSGGVVIGETYVGGLVGSNQAGNVSSSYSTGNVTGVESVGGLVGWNEAGDVSDCYSTGSVAGGSSVGGLAGVNAGTVSKSYSASSVTGVDNVGGLVGENQLDGVVSNSFWDIETSGKATSAGGTGKTAAEMRDMATFSDASWNITTVADPGTRNPSYIWNIVNNATYPFQSWRAV